jgi:RNA polymerase sigma-70 factor (ECF subfamily)
MTQSESSTSADLLANEKKAIAHLKRGNLSGLSVLVQAHQIKAVHAALLIVRDQGTAEEIVQEAFVQAFRKIDQFDDRRPFGPWFIRSVIHSALKIAEKQKRIEALDEPQDGPRIAEWLIDPGLAPQEVVETAEFREAVWQALAKLTPNQRAAVVMRYFLDESESEMVSQLNRPLTTIKWWLHSAREKLKVNLHTLHETESESQEVDRE